MRRQPRNYSAGYIYNITSSVIKELKIKPKHIASLSKYIRLASEKFNIKIVSLDIVWQVPLSLRV